MFSRCTDRVLLRLRYFGSGLLVVGYFVILYVSVPVGVTMTLLSDAICLPYALASEILGHHVHHRSILYY